MSAYLDFPKEPARGEKLDAIWGAKVARCLRALALLSGLGYRVKRDGNGTRLEIIPSGGRGVIAETPGALTFTKIAPRGWVRPEAAEGVPIFMTRGVAGGLFPPASLWQTPVCYVTEAGDTYVWAKIGLSETVALLVTSLEFVTSDEPNAYVTDPFDEDGSPPPFLYVPLGTISASGTDPLLIDLFPSGGGSIVVAVHMSNITLSGSSQTYTRQLSYWRTADAP